MATELISAFKRGGLREKIEFSVASLGVVLVAVVAVILPVLITLFETVTRFNRSPLEGIFMLILGIGVLILILVGLAVAALLAVPLGFIPYLSVLIVVLYLPFGIMRVIGRFGTEQKGDWESLIDFVYFGVYSGVLLGICIGILLARNSRLKKYSDLMEKKKQEKEAKRLRGILGNDYEWAVDNLSNSDLLALTTDDAHYEPAESQQGKVLGLPGIDLMHDVGGKLSSSAVRAGIDGEIWTAEILNDVRSVFPEITILHGLKVKEDSGWDVDHAVVFGNLVLFIDSKAYKPDDFAWFGDAICTYPPSTSKARTNHLASAVNELNEMLPEWTTVASVVVIHGRDHEKAAKQDGVRVVGDPNGNGNPTLITGADLEQWLIELLSNEELPASWPHSGVAAQRHNEIVSRIRKCIPRDYQEVSQTPSDDEEITFSSEQQSDEETHGTFSVNASQGWGGVEGASEADDSNPHSEDAETK